ncbi:uncharacterized protein LOC132558126 [Ylistrum balloti]|uniref:uncharacterized protein LOC132558126 n=1 Tax=Ylistrum balloti TaxID=509963 RepID=UPI002905D789|nr:uncharacterized protein LOC132558126 [Ylistrum balloti]
MYLLCFALVLGIGVHGTAGESLAERDVMYSNPSDVWMDNRAAPPEKSLRRLVESLLERMESQDNKIKLLEQRVKDNEEDLNRKEIRISHLEQELKSVSKQSQDSIDNLQTEGPEDTNETRSRFISTEKRGDEHHSRIVRVSPNGVGAFSVSLSGRDLNLQPSLVIAFDEILLDVDGNYHLGDGVYRVPVTGVYVFTWCTTGTTTDNVVTELVVNGTPRGTIFSDAETGHAWDSSTGVIVTLVSEGDHVFIRSKFSGVIHSSDVYGKSMFSGWRLS